MPLPEITHLQFAVLCALLDAERLGRHVREKLAELGVHKTLAAFYQLMARLEDAGLVEGRYEHEVVDGIPIKERRYKITDAGISAWEDARDFYQVRAVLGLRGA